MTEQDSGWKASVDGVVSDFDEVTQHLRLRQGQALRVAWSVVAATALAMGALLVLDLVPAGVGRTPVASSFSPGLSVLSPGAGGVAAPGLGLALTTPGAAATASPDIAAPVTPATTAATGTPRPRAHRVQVAPVIASLPVTTPVQVLPVPSTPAEASPSPAAPPPSSSPSGGIVDSLVGSVLHGAG